jgi:hypothetical protein
MTASTRLQLVNKVLRRLREDEVATVDENDYSTLIGDLLNQAKREVEDAWNWSRLRTTIQVTTVSGTYRYVLTGAGDRFKILDDPLTGKPDVMNDTGDIQLMRAPSSNWMTQRFLVGTPQQSTPLYFDFNGFNTSGDPYVDLWPIPNSAQVINFNMVLPQDDLSSDSTKLTVPELPVILRTHSLAVSERGEDGGARVNELDMQFSDALANAISIDQQYMSNEMVFQVE